MNLLQRRPLKVPMLLSVALLAAEANIAAESQPEEPIIDLMSAWNQHDAHAFASQFAEDATFVNVNGWLWIGRKDIEDRHANAAIFKSSHAEIKPQTLQLLTPDVALLHVGWTITGDSRDSQPRGYLMTMIVTKTAGHWFIVAAQNGSSIDRSTVSGTRFLPPSSLPAKSGEHPAIRILFAAADDDWNVAKTGSLANLFTEDSDLVDTLAHHFHGRADILQYTAELLAHSFKGTHSHTTVLTAISLSPDLAVLEVRWELEDGARGATPLTITGLRLVSRKNGSWLIRAAQDTITRPLPSQKP